MNTTSKKIFLFLALYMLSLSAFAINIYPIDRAQILSGSKFDIKVELDEVNENALSKITINGKQLSQLFGKGPEVIINEEGKGSSFIWRDVSISNPGSYELVFQRETESFRVKWEIYSTGPRKIKNIVLFIGDGMTIANRTAARVLSRGIKEGKYLDKLSFDNMPYTALIGTSGVDSLITDSANSMSAYSTGHKSSINAMGVYVSRSKDNLAHPKVENILEIIKRKTNMAVGIVTDTELVDATPAAMVAHTRRRAEKQYIADQLLSSKADVILGGGGAYFYPQSSKGSKRQDENNLVDLFKKGGYEFVNSREGLVEISNKTNTIKLFGIFHPDNMDGALDRFVLKANTVKDYPNQPDLSEMTQAAINTLSKNPNGFFLMVEAGLIDKFNHSLDWERAAFDTIMLSNAVDVAKKFARKNPNTLVIVVPDHTHSGSISGVVNDLKSGALKEKVGTYADAGYPNYPKANVFGYPEKIDVEKRLAFFYGNYPDHYETMHPKLDGTFVPAIKNDQQQFIANPKYKQLQEDAIHITGNLPYQQEHGVHTADDAVLNAVGPGGDKFKGFMDNTEVFKVMVDLLGLGKK
jgi:alkaline phosphatase